MYVSLSLSSPQVCLHNCWLKQGHAQSHHCPRIPRFQARATVSMHEQSNAEHLSWLKMCNKVAKVPPQAVRNPRPVCIKHQPALRIFRRPFAPISFLCLLKKSKVLGTIRRFLNIPLGCTATLFEREQSLCVQDIPANNKKSLNFTGNPQNKK